MEIRQYSPEYEAAVIELWQQCGLTRPWNNPEADIGRKLRTSLETFFIGLIGDSVVSTVMAGYDGHRGWVHYLAVHPDHQKQGLGRLIMQAAEDALKAAGCPKVNLMVRTTNTSVIQFYKRIGYDQDDVITMSRRLVDDEPFIG